MLKKSTNYKEVSKAQQRNSELRKLRAERSAREKKGTTKHTYNSCLNLKFRKKREDGGREVERR